MHYMWIFSIFMTCSIVASMGDDHNDENALYPLHWSLAPSSFNDYPLIDEFGSTHRLIDPWSYVHRLGLYKIMIEITTPLMPFCASSNASNILFALPSQFGWLFQSNRLFTNGTMNISLNSWWGSANYYLAVVPFLVAMDLNLIEKQPFRIVEQEHFCTTLQQCQVQVPETVKEWYRFFLQLQQWKTCLGDAKFDRRVVDRCYLAPMWSAFKTTIDHALPLVANKLHFLPSDTEKEFGLSWARLINLAAMTRKNTNLYETINNQRRFLPFRLLNDNDRTPSQSDLPVQVKKSLEVLFSIRFDWLSFIETIWQRLTCNYEARVEAQYSLDTMAVSKLLAWHYMAKATINAFLYNCDRFS